MQRYLMLSLLTYLSLSTHAEEIAPDSITGEILKFSMRYKKPPQTPLIKVAVLHDCDNDELIYTIITKVNLELFGPSPESYEKNVIEHEKKTLPHKLNTAITKTLTEMIDRTVEHCSVETLSRDDFLACKLDNHTRCVLLENKHEDVQYACITCITKDEFKSFLVKHCKPRLACPEDNLEDYCQTLAQDT